MLMRAPEQLPGKDFSAIKTKMDRDYTNNISIWSIMWTQANIAIRAEAGDESLMAQLGTNMGGNGRGSYYFNRVRPITNMMSGVQRQNRKTLLAAPLENGDNKTADQFTKIMFHISKKENVYEVVSEAFHMGALITGMSLMQIYLDFSRDPINGDIKVDHLAYNEFMCDPYWRNSNLSDCRFIWRRTFMDHAAAAAIMPPENYDEIMSLPGNMSGNAKDGRFQYLPEAFGYTQGNKVSYDEYYYRDYRMQKLLVDKKTLESFDVSHEENVDIEAFLRDNPQVKLEERMIPTVRMAVMIQDRVFYDGPQPLGIDEFPFVPVTGFYNKSMPYMYSRIQGIVKSLIDPQILFNRRVILSADYAESAVNTGWIFKENAPVDVKHLFQTGQGRIIPLKDEAQMTDIQQIQPPQIPPSFFQLQEVFDKELYNCAGISQENMGKIVDDQASGFKAALRQGAGLVAMQPLFDRLDTSLKMLGDRLIEVIQRNYTPSKIKLILEGEEPAELFYNKAFGKYHCMTELGFDTDTQKQLMFAQLLELKNAGVPIADEDLIEAATLQGKDKLIENMRKKQEQAAQQQQQIAESQMQLNHAQSKLANARAMADIGLYNERTSRVEENRALANQKMHEANQNDARAMLDKVKALKELESMDIDHLERLIMLANNLKMMENADAEKGQAEERMDDNAQEAYMKQQAQTILEPQPQNQPQQALAPGQQAG